MEFPLFQRGIFRHFSDLRLSENRRAARLCWKADNEEHSRQGTSGCTEGGMTGCDWNWGTKQGVTLRMTSRKMVVRSLTDESAVIQLRFR